MCIYLHSKVFITLLLLCQYRLLDARGILFSSDIKLDSKTRQYNNLVVVISSDQNKNNCKQMLTELQETLTEASRSLHDSLDGSVMLGGVTVQLPGTWTQADCGLQLSSSNYIGTGDVYLSTSGQSVISYQSVGECGARGDYLELPSPLMAANRTLQAGQDLGAALLRLLYGVWHPTSVQLARCWGQSASQVIRSHPDFVLSPGLPRVNFTSPSITVTSYSPPSYVIVLENSAMMGSQWDLVRTVLRNLILEQEYLPDNAKLGLVMFNSAAYTSHPLVPLTEPNRQSLSLSIRSKHNLSPSTESCVSCGLSKAVESLHGSPGVIILISRAGLPATHTDTWSLATKHHLRIFSVVIPPLGQTLPLPTLDSHNTFLINSSTSFLSMFRQCLHVTDTILRSTLANYRAVVHEALYEPFVSGENNVEGRFVVDEYSGGNSSLKVYFTDIVESYIKSISVRSDSGDTFNTIMDDRINLHYYSIYNVPFDSQDNLGRSWSYRISRLSSPAQSNTHLVRASSAGSEAGVSVDVWSHSVQGRLSRAASLILYTRLTLGMKPVVNATVVCTTETGYSVQLLDSGAGDPDTVQGDGVYSRYLQYLTPGSHSLACTVYGQKSYVAGIQPAPLSQFTRTVCCVPVVVGEGEVGMGGPPARILDLRMGVVTASQQIELQWTAPGDDYDWGKLASYQLFSSPRADSYYSSPQNTSQASLVQSFSAGQHAGQQEQHTVRINVFDKEMFYVLVPVDSDGNVGEISNIVSAYMPRPQIMGGEAGTSNTPLREGLFDPMRRPTEPNLVIMYVIVGIVCIVIFTFIVIVTVIIVIRNKTAESCDNSRSSDNLHQNSTSGLPHSQSKESLGDYKVSMTGNSQECLDIFNHLPSTRENNTYIKGYQTSPTYAKPVPKSMRKSKTDQNNLTTSCDVKQNVGFVIREDGDGEEEYSHYKDNYVDYARISTLKKVAPPTLPKPSCKPDILSNSNSYSAYPATTRNITTV